MQTRIKRGNVWKFLTPHKTTTNFPGAGVSRTERGIHVKITSGPLSPQLMWSIIQDSRSPQTQPIKMLPLTAYPYSHDFSSSYFTFVRGQIVFWNGIRQALIPPHPKTEFSVCFYQTLVWESKFCVNDLKRVRNHRTFQIVRWSYFRKQTKGCI